MEISISDSDIARAVQALKDGGINFVAIDFDVSPLAFMITI